MSTTAIDGLVRVHDVVWELPAVGDMRVPGRVYATEDLLASAGRADVLAQVRNVATLPGIVRYSLAMPDIHFGYGFPIGGVAAFRVEDGVVSPGGVGYDINCGVRLLTTELQVEDIKDSVKRVIDQLFRDVPAGVGSSGAIEKLTRSQLEAICVQGARWAVEGGYGTLDDLERTEAGGALPGADPSCISQKAFARGMDQVGTLGAGNHFLELQAVDEVFDERAAAVFGLRKDQVVLMIHVGSRAFGYQICDDYLEIMGRAVSGYGIRLPDRQLACAPVSSPEGGQYLAAMACAANYAWANRQMLKHLAERALLHALSISPESLGVRMIYDVAHNIAKIERHVVDGRELTLCVHRKGATRAFGPGHPEIPAPYTEVGQPVLIPGDMGTGSFVCKGTQRAMEETFGSTCHGAGRVMSRSQALKRAKGRAIDRELGEQGIVVRARGRKTLGEEMPEAYKDVEAVVRVMDRAGISPRVARLRPLGVIKG